MKTKKTVKKRFSGKPEAYDALCAINHGFEDVVANLEKLLTLDLFHGRPQRGFLKSCQLAVEEARAWVSFEITDVLRGYEETKWASLGRLRGQQVKGLENHNDVSIDLTRVESKLTDKGAKKIGPKNSER